MNHDLSLSTHVLLAPRRAGLVAGQANVVDVLVRIQAPDAPAGHAAERPPQALALVLDRSGSMAGRPLLEARRCAEYVLRTLRPGDAASIVEFDHRVRRLWPAVPVGDGAGQRLALAGVRAGGNTNLHGGWREGADTLADVAGSGLKRVILLSDGQANEGVVDVAEIAAQCARWAAQGITTSTYGLGDAFNETLMVAMAEAGGGNHYYGDTADDLMEPFEQELQLLGNLALREIELVAMPREGIEVTMKSPHPAHAGGWRLPDLAWGAEAWAVLQLRVPAGLLPPQGRLLQVLRVQVRARDLQGEAVELERAGLALPVLAPGPWQALQEDELVGRRMAELAVAAAMDAMRAAAGEGDWARVEELLAEARERFGGNPWLAAILGAMQDLATHRQREKFSKEALYSSRKMGLRLSARDESPALDAAGDRTPAFLRRKPAQGKADSR